MYRTATLLVCCILLLCAAPAFPSVFGEGPIDNDLSFEDFQVTPDGFVTGYVVNASGAARQGVTLDLWITNPQETRIFWRKTVSIASIGPKSRFQVKEPFGAGIELPERIKFMMRLQNKDNFRNK